MSGKPDIALVSVGGGALALTHRPKLKSLPALRALGVTHLVTLLAEREGARQIGDAAVAAELTSIWFPLDSGDVPSEARTVERRAITRGLELDRRRIEVTDPPSRTRDRRPSRPGCSD